MRRSIIIPLLMAVTACGTARAVDATAPPLSPDVVTVDASIPAIAEATTDPAPAREPDGGGLAEISPHVPSEHATMVAKTSAEVEVFADPESEEPVRVLDPTTILGTVTVLTVVEGPESGWVKVMLPGRPNGSEGWIRTDGVELYMVYSMIEVDLSDRVLTYYEDGVEVITTTVAVGSGSNPTPTGTYFVTDNVTLKDPNSPWGPHALGLSARSATVMEYNGGDGIIGIHGTNKPQSIGSDASLGCVRVPNEVITALHEAIRIGTPVRIDA